MEGLLIIVICFTFIGGVLVGTNTASKENYIPQGRNEGIIFCMENKNQCKTEYDYLKLKENQK